MDVLTQGWGRRRAQAELARMTLGSIAWRVVAVGLIPGFATFLLVGQVAWLMVVGLSGGLACAAIYAKLRPPVDAEDGFADHHLADGRPDPSHPGR